MRWFVLQKDGPGDSLSRPTSQSTEESGRALFDPEKNQFVLTGPELIVFCERDKKDT